MMIKENERIIYEEFMTMFKFAPRMCYTLYDKAEEEIEKLQQENQQLKENYDRIYNENCKLREEHNITDISLLDENQQLKKQKDDVVEYIKEHIKYECDNAFNGMQFYSYHLYDFNKEELLRMLGEIDEIR